MALEFLPSGVQDAIQTNQLKRRFEDKLRATNAYRKTAYRLPIEKRSGESIIYSRNGHISPVMDDIVPSTNVGIDNGLTINGVGGNGDYSFEQFSVTIGLLPKFMDLNILQNEEVIGDLYLLNAEELAEQAALSLDLRVARVAFRAYMGGQSYFTAGGTGTTLRVDNVLGLDTAFGLLTINGKVVVNGAPQAVSNTYPLTVYITSATTGIITTATVTGVTYDDTTGFPDDPANISSLGVYGRSGTLTFSASQTVGQYDVIQSADSPVMYRPNGKNSVVGLDLTDTIGAQLVINAVAELRANGVKSPLKDGTFPCYIDPILHAQFFTDPQWQIMSQGQMQSEDFADGVINRNFGVTFVPTTNAPSNAITNHAGLPLVARRAIVTGDKYVQESPFSGIDALFSAPGGARPVHTQLMDDFVFATRAPIDREGQFVSMGWYWVGGHVAPTDATITPDTIPSSTKARYKRAVVIEAASSR